MIIIITGNPGVGKHTVTKKIAKDLNLPIFDINVIAKEGGLLEKVKNSNDVDLEELEEVIKKKSLKSGILVGHLAPYTLSKDKVDKVIILRRNPYDLISVYKERGYPDDKIKENVGSEVLGIIAFDSSKKFGNKCFQVDVSNKTILENVKTIKEIIQNERNNEEIDWLELVARNNDLEKFFAY